MLLTISVVNKHMVSHKRSITAESESNTSFLNPIERICFQICSIGFISGAYGGMERSCIFSGQRNAFDLCHRIPTGLYRRDTVLKVFQEIYWYIPYRNSASSKRNFLRSEVLLLQGWVPVARYALPGSDFHRTVLSAPNWRTSYVIYPITEDLGFHLFTDFFSQAHFVQIEGLTWSYTQQLIYHSR